MERTRPSAVPDPPLTCGACGAENDADCLRCAYCAARIGAAARPEPSGDVADVVPPEVRAELAERSRQAEERLQASVARRVGRVKRRAAMAAAAFLGAALLLGAALPWPAYLAFLALDPLLGAGGVALHAHRRGGPALGGALLGLPLAATSLAKVVAATATHGVTGLTFAHLGLLIGFTGVGITGGYLLGMRADEEALREA